MFLAQILAINRTNDNSYIQILHSVVIVFAEKKTLFNLMFAVKKKGTPPPFTWIIGDSVLHREPHDGVMSQIIDVVEGALLVRPETINLPGFDDYFRGLMINKAHGEKNPWFDEFVTQYVNCDENMVSSMFRI